jgi:cytochrome c553
VRRILTTLADRRPGWGFVLAGLLLSGLISAPAPVLASGDVEAGRAKAQRECSACHGLNGVAKRPDAPNIGGESDLYLEIQLDAFRSGARKHEEMSIIAAGLSDQDIADVIAWYSSLRYEIQLPE